MAVMTPSPTRTQSGLPPLTMDVWTVLKLKGNHTLIILFALVAAVMNFFPRRVGIDLLFSVVLKLSS